MDILDSVSCGDDYTTAATIEDVFGSNGGYFVVNGNDVFIQLQYGIFGLSAWTREVHVPVGNGILQRHTAGVRFRNYKAGAVAVISAALSEEVEPAIALTAGGQASVSGTLTPPVTIPASTAPDTSLLPSLTVGRFISHNNLQGDFGGDGAQDFAAITVSNEGAASNLNGVQPVGIFAFSGNQGTQAPNGTGAAPDAVAVYGEGQITNGGTGLAAGGFFIAQRTATAAAGIITAVQVQTNNQLNNASYSPTAVTDTCLWLSNASTKHAGSAVLIGPSNTLGLFDVGIGIMGAASGPIINASFRDDGNAVSCIVLNGSHTGFGLDLSGGTFTGGAIKLPEGGNVVLGTATGTQIGTATGQKLGFYGKAPIVQQVLDTGVGHTVDDVISFLQLIGLVKP